MPRGKKPTKKNAQNGVTKSSDRPSRDKKVSADVENDPSVVANVEEKNAVWDIVRTIPKGGDRVCRTEGCKSIAVVTWASNVDPSDEWDLCEPCQDSEFGGWPEGFHRHENSPPEGSQEPSLEEEAEQDTQESLDVASKTFNTDIGDEKPVDTVSVNDGGVQSSAAPHDLQESVNEDEEDPATNNKGGRNEDIPVKESSEGAGNKSDHESQDSESVPPEKPQEDSGCDEMEQEEMWDLKKVLSFLEIAKDCPIKCSTDDCAHAACSIWVSSLAPKDKWYSCMDCQEKDFEGWPTPEELPITVITNEHKRIMAEKCSGQKSPLFPQLSLGNETSPKRKTGDGSMSHTITPPPSSANSRLMPARKQGKDSMVTPSPATTNISRPTQQSKILMNAHRKWQEQAEALGGPGARIIVSKPAAKKLIFDMLHDAFCPMNITQIHKKLKAVVPSPVLKSCLDDMALDKGDDNPFADSDSENEDKTSSKSQAAKASNSSDDPYSGALAFKAGRNVNTSLYFVDHTKLKNNGNGLESEERNALAANLVQTEAEDAQLTENLKRIISETEQLLSEPTNEEAAASLEAGETVAKENEQKLEAARKLKVNQKHKVQTKKRIESMAAQWRKRKRLCMDFLITIEESTDGAVSVKKCLAGDGQIEIDSDEAVIAGAIAFGKRKRMKIAGRKGSKVSARNPVSGTKSGSNASVAKGMLHSESFVGVNLDSSGRVCRVHIDGDEDSA